MIVSIKEDALGTETVLRRFPDISFRQLHYWTSRGWVTPQNTRTGTGIPMLYARDQVTRIQYMSLLVNKLGFNPGAASALLDSVFEDGKLDGDYLYYEKHGFILALPLAKVPEVSENNSDNGVQRDGSM